MTAAQSLNLYHIALRYFKNEADAISFVKEIEVVVDNKFDSTKDILATKQDLAESKVDIIKWMVAMWLTLALMLVGLYLKK